MTSTRRRLLQGAAAFIALPRFARAQAAWPDKPIRLIVPFAAGGPTDVVARTIAARLTEQLRQTVVVENRTGASGNLAAQAVAKSAPDGYTVLYHSSGFAISPALTPKLDYDPVKDFTPVALTAVIPTVITINNALPAQNIQAFLDHLKANPGQLSYGSGGPGNITHLVVAMVLQAKGLSAVHVPYRGTAPATIDLISGQVQFMADAINSQLPYIRDNRLRAVAVASETRSPALPNVPTLAESVLPGFSAPTWHGLWMPARTPAAIVDRVNAAVGTAVNDPALRAQYAGDGVELRGLSPDAFAAYVRKELDKWSQAVKAAGIQPA